MVGTPRPKRKKCKYCGGILKRGEGEHALDLFVWGIKEYKEEDGWHTKDIKLPDNVRAEMLLTSRFGHDEEGYTTTDESGKYIDEVIPIMQLVLSDKESEGSHFMAMETEIRYCPFCGRDMYEHLN